MSLNKEIKHIILKITNQGVFYNENSFIEWGKTNFPPKDDFNFNERAGIFWKVKLLSFDNEISQLRVNVVNYDAYDEEASFANQSAKFSFQKIWFDKLKWIELQKVMNVYKAISFNKISDVNNKQINERKVVVENLADYSEIIVENKRVEINFEHSLIKTKFKMGFIEIEKKLKGFPEKIKINLSNSNIIPEFDHVKPFFAKALGKRTIEVIGYLEIDDTGETEIKCQSKEISQINENLITTVRRLRLKESIFNPKKITIDKSLFTPEEYFEGFEEDQLGNTITKKDKDILGQILQLEEIRNRNQLLYLSGKLQSNKIGLRFTLSPKFGFLFYVEGREMDHFIWELLNTNATYIWSIEKDGYSLENKLKLIEREVNFIRENGRNIYLNSEKNVGFIFNKINHENSETGVIDGFPKWKMRVNEKII